MRLITPTQQSKRTLRAGDVVVWESGLAYLMVLENGGLCCVDLSNGYRADTVRSPEDWIAFWNADYPDYTIYSADEWDLQLVPKRS
jgi:hypothetical protein